MNDYKGCNNCFPELHSEHDTKINFEVVVSKFMGRTLYEVLYPDFKIVRFIKKKKQSNNVQIKLLFFTHI